MTIQSAACPTLASAPNLHPMRRLVLLCVILFASTSLRAQQFPPPAVYGGLSVHILYDRNDNGGTVLLAQLPTVPGAQYTTINNFGTTWTHIVAGRFGGGGAVDFLFYDSNSGIAKLYSYENGWPGSLTLFRQYTDWSPGWTSIVPGNFGGTAVTGQSDLLLYNSATGVAGFFDVWGQGNINLMKGYTDWSTGTTHIVPGNFGGTAVTGQNDLLLYDAATGSAGFFDVWGQGNINLMKGYTDWSTGTTHIIPGNFGGIGETDLLLYNAATGSAGFFDVWGQGNIQIMQGYSNWSAGHTFIMPGDFGETSQTGQTDLMIYDASIETAGFLDVWGKGNLNSFLTQPSFGHWSLMATNFAVEPWAQSLQTAYGKSAVTFVIKGMNLNGAQQVWFGGRPGNQYHIPNYRAELLPFTVISSTTLVATLPYSNVTPGFFSVVTPTGTSNLPTPYLCGLDGAPACPENTPKTVQVPYLIGDSLQAAVRILQQVGLQQGTVSGAAGFNLVVVSQSPGANTRAAQGSSVNLVVAAAPSGFSSVALTNYLQNNESVYVWLFDGLTNTWTIQNGGNLLAEGDSVTITLTDQAPYVVADLDPNACGLEDPSHCSLGPWSWTVMGNPQGPALTQPMSN